MGFAGMKILQISHSFPPYSFAGVEVHVSSLSSMLQKRHQVKVVHPITDESAADGDIQYGDYNGIDTLRIVNNRQDPNVVEIDVFPKIRSAFVKILEDEKPDIVHFQHMLSLSADMVDEVASRGIPLVGSLHDFWYICLRVQFYIPGIGRCKGPGVLACSRCHSHIGSLIRFVNDIPGVDSLLRSFFRNSKNPTYNRVAKRMDRMLHTLRTLDHIIANSHHLKGRYVRFGVPKDKMSIIRYGFDVERIRQCRHPVGDKVRFGYTGSIIEHKGIHDLIEAFRRIPDAELQIHGDYDINPITRSYYDSMNPPPNVTFKGGFAQSELTHILKGIDVLIVPSIWEEAYGMVLDEAKAAGIPVIATRIGGIPEHLDHGKEGYLYEPGDVDELERRVRRFAERPGHVDELRPSGDDVTTVEENMRSIETIYERLLKAVDSTSSHLDRLASKK